MNALTADGIAINKVVNVNTEPRNGFMPVTNMWCPQTMKDRNAMAKMEVTMAR